MHTAQIEQWGQPPRYVEVNDLASPSEDQVRIKVLATGIHQVVRTRASGKHYTSGALPHVPGVDGVGLTDDGQLVYWFNMEHGSMAEYVVTSKRNVRPLPAGTDPVQAAAGINPALSSWMALKTRVVNLPKDFTVLILGVTSASGRLAVPIARALGAKRVIGAARNAEATATIGLDGTVVIQDDPKQTDFSNIGDVDVVLDYVYGSLTVHLFGSLRSSRRVQYVHIGGLSGEMEISIPGSVLRSKNLTISGSGPGAWSMREVAESIADLLHLVKDFPAQPVEVFGLADIEQVWNKKSNGRMVIKP